jgi:hypothetical protein
VDKYVAKRYLWLIGGIIVLGAFMAGIGVIKKARPKAKGAFPIDGALPSRPRFNAYDSYAEIIRDLNVPNGLKRQKPNQWKNYRGVDKILAANDGALARADSALERVYVEPPSSDIVPFFLLQVKIKELCRLLILRGDIAFSKQNYRAAMADYLRVARVGWQISNGSYDAGFISGDRLLRTGLEALERTIKHLPKRERELLGRRLASMGSCGVPMSRPIEWEKVQNQIAWNRILAEPNWAKVLRKDLGVEQLFDDSSYKPDRIEELKGNLGFEADRISRFERFFADNTRPLSVYENSSAYYEAWIERVQGKFSQRSPTMPSLVASGNIPDVFTAWIQEVELRYTLDDQRWLSRLKTMTCLKLMGIYLLGDSAFAIAPLMEDPFDPGKRFMTLRRSGRTLVYSVGPDGKDDRGVPRRGLLSFVNLEDLESYKGDLIFPED